MTVGSAPPPAAPLPVFAPSLASVFGSSSQLASLRQESGEFNELLEGFEGRLKGPPETEFPLTGLAPVPITFLAPAIPFLVPYVPVPVALAVEVPQAIPEGTVALPEGTVALPEGTVALKVVPASDDLTGLVPAMLPVPVEIAVDANEPQSASLPLMFASMFTLLPPPPQVPGELDEPLEVLPGHPEQTGEPDFNLTAPAPVSIPLPIFNPQLVDPPVAFGAPAPLSDQSLAEPVRHEARIALPIHLEDLLPAMVRAPVEVVANAEEPPPAPVAFEVAVSEKAGATAPEPVPEQVPDPGFDRFEIQARTAPPPLSLPAMSLSARDVVPVLQAPPLVAHEWLRESLSLKPTGATTVVSGPPAPANEIALRIPAIQAAGFSRPDAASAKPVELRIAQSGAEVRISVHSGDPRLSSAMQESLGQLTESLRAGQNEVHVTAPPRITADAAAGDRESFDHSDSPGRGQQQQQGRNQRRRPQFVGRFENLVRSYSV